jgi:beta-N-acetylhexosaminidase
MISRRVFLQNVSGAAVLAAVSPDSGKAVAGPQASAPRPDSLSIEEKVGQMVIARLEDWPLMEKYARQGIISGMTPSLRDKSPSEAARFLNHFQEISKYPLLFGWGGHFPGATEVRTEQLMRLGATRSKELCYRAAKIEAEESRAVGIHLGNTPYLDVNTNPDNPIINLRSLSDRPELVTELGIELCRGTLEGRAASLVAHFPGHGATSTDSHIDIAVVNRTLTEIEEIDLKPFAEVIRLGLASLVMTNHCYYPALEPERKIPATISRKIITGILRRRLGYNGVIISDSLTMRAVKDHYGIEEAAIETVAAGHDLILQDYNSDPRITIDALIRAVRQGRIPVEQIDESVRRVWKLKAWLGLFGYRAVDVSRVDQNIGTDENGALARRIAKESVTVLESTGLPLAAGQARRILVISNGSRATIDEDLERKHSPANHFFRRCMIRRVPEARPITLSTQFSAEELEHAAEAARNRDTIVFGLFTRVQAYGEDSIRIDERYSELIREIASLGKRVVLCNFGNPWVLRELVKPAVCLCTFSDAEDSIEAAVQVLFGELTPKGRLPIEISSDYPFGFGL